MIPITEVVTGIFKIGPLETGRVTPNVAPYVVVGEEKAAIVEMGEDGQTAELLKAITLTGEEGLSMDLNKFAYIMASHVHLHHVSGINLLLKAMPNAKAVIHHFGVPHLVEPTRLNAGTLQVWGQDSGCPQISPVPEDRIISARGGEVIDLGGGRELELIETLGHCPHHMSIFDRLTKTLFPGDAAGAFFAGPGHYRTRPDILPPLYDAKLSVESVRRLRALKPELLLVFGHNAMSRTPDDTLRWAEEDILAIESICREGMEQKKSNLQIGTEVREYYDSVGIALQEDERNGTMAGGGMGGGGGPIAMYTYLKRENPSLEIPQ
jgi:glyoxylase-like metal-dependent hydrolase (beta-lactamase superfamily II)